MLVGCQPECALVDLGYFPQTGLKVPIRFILDSSIFDEHGEVVPAILAS